MAHHGKRYNKLADRVDAQRRYPVGEAVSLLKGMRSAKFDESVELALKLDIDAKQADQLVRGSFSLPRGTGKQVRVIAFCEGPEADAAREAGAIEVGSEELAKKISEGWMDFDVAIAHPAMMRHVGKLGRVLGPQGKMPSPKSGTVTPHVAQAVSEFRAGKIEYRNDSFGNLNVPVGKGTFEEEALVENIESFLQHILAIRPQAVKGLYLTKAAISLTMSPGVRLSV